jgi:hypothetical protein
MKTIVKVPDVEEKQIDPSEVIDLIKESKQTIEAILIDYVAGPGCELEVNAAIDNLIQSVESIESFDAEIEFDDIVKQLKEMPSSDIVTEEILEILDEDKIVDWAAYKCPNYVVIKLESLGQREKLTEFLKAEIFPFHNDQTSENSNLF